MADLLNAGLSGISGEPTHHALNEALTGGIAAMPTREMERRRALRVTLPFPATVRGIDRMGKRFEAETVLDNMSACGLYMRMEQQIEVGAKLFIVVRLSLTRRGAPAPRVAIKGRVVRVEPHPDGRYGVGVEFTRHRFLYAA